jgi:hypothetical protein
MQYHIDPKHPKATELEITQKCDKKLTKKLPKQMHRYRIKQANPHKSKQTHRTYEQVHWLELLQQRS